MRANACIRSLFGTRLTNVTARQGEGSDEAWSRSGDIADWSGGTIAYRFVFNKLWARRVLTQGAIVLLAPTGSSAIPTTGSPSRSTGCTLLPAADLAQSAVAVFRFEAKAKGIRTMVPHVDELQPIHNLDPWRPGARALGHWPRGRRSQSLVGEGGVTAIAS
jgi:uncharacterized protein with von Willebrand factor type A (vWA) domain